MGPRIPQTAAPLRNQLSSSVSSGSSTSQRPPPRAFDREGRGGAPSATNLAAFGREGRPLPDVVTQAVDLQVGRLVPC